MASSRPGMSSSSRARTSGIRVMSPGLSGRSQQKASLACRLGEDVAVDHPEAGLLVDGIRVGGHHDGAPQVPLLVEELPKLRWLEDMSVSVDNARHGVLLFGGWYCCSGKLFTTEQLGFQSCILRSGVQLDETSGHLKPLRHEINRCPVGAGDNGDCCSRIQVLTDAGAYLVGVATADQTVYQFIGDEVAPFDALLVGGGPRDGGA